MPNYVCSDCKKEFTRRFNYDRHISRKFPCTLTLGCLNPENRTHNNINTQEIPSNNEISEYTPDKEISFVQEFKKLRDEVEMLKSQPSTTTDNSEFKKLRDEVEMLKNKPTTTNQVLQVVCIKNDENYLNLLTDLWGDHTKALEFIKDCALSSLSGDCKLLKKIYFESNEAPFRYLDNARTKLEYFNEKKERIIDYKGERLCRILANNLQNSYLKGVNYVINRNLENKLCPNKFLDDYDIQSWNAHIYQLSDEKYQKKIISQLDIPKI